MIWWLLGGAVVVAFIWWLARIGALAGLAELFGEVLEGIAGAVSSFD